ncbi:MAG TPA: hypothetical protein VK666_27705 [Chryseolinea sp.]|nr:hypothetical protein [Chryseolinea sp.]
MEDAEGSPLVATNGNLYENGVTSTATTAPVLAKFIKTDLPEIESVVRIFHSNRSKIFHHGGKSFYETGMYDTDSSIFNVFTFPLRSFPIE